MVCARPLAAFVLSGLACGSALGQVTPEPQPTVPRPAEPADGGVKTEFTLFGSHQFSTDLDVAGSVSVSRVGGQLGAAIPVGEHDLFNLDIAAQGTFYSFDGATGLAADGDPVGTVEYFGISGRYFHRLSERWGVYAGGGISSSGEPGADFGDTLQFGGGGGFTYFFSKSLSISPGLFVRTELEESVRFVPLVNVDWQIDEQWRLATIFRAAGSAPGLALSYSPTDEWTFTLAGSYENRTYRLDNEGTAPGGTFRDRRLPIDLSAQWKITPSLSLEATAGVSVMGEFRLRSSNGDFLAEEDLNPAPFAGLTLTFRF